MCLCEFFSGASVSSHSPEMKDDDWRLQISCRCECEFGYLHVWLLALITSYSQPLPGGFKKKKRIQGGVKKMINVVC